MSSKTLVGRTLGQYELREYISSGGMGEVYRGYHLTSEREVAVKVLRPEFTSERGYINRFRREAKIAAALEHPHIVPFYDYGLQEGIRYIVMRWLTGGTLEQKLEQGPRPLRETADLISQLASALAYAHSRELIHRDIKPGNVMFDGDGTAYLVDFGVAKPLKATRLTESGVTVGTLAYMPPEQAQADVLTPAADQYALAVLAYEMLTGYLPFQAPTPPPEAVSQILKRALAREADRRFPTVTAFARAFESALGGAWNTDPRLLAIPMSGRGGDLGAVKKLLKNAPAAIVGVGGLGKSRLAAEVVVTSEDVDGAVWQRVNEFSYPDSMVELLRQHFGLEASASRREAIEPLRTHKRLIVIDNAESLGGERRQDYVALIGELHQAGAQVLLTNRTEWRELESLTGKTHPLDRLPAAAATQVALDMIEIWGAPSDVHWVAADIAQAARCHPWMIEWAVRQTLKREVSRVLQVLAELKSQKAQDALYEIIGKTLRQMTGETGPEAEAALKRLAVNRGGFTYAAAEAVLELGDPDLLDDRLEALQDWQFVTMRMTEAGRRYEIDPLVIEAVGVDQAARRPHYHHYLALAKQHEGKQDYLGLDVESANIEVAFEWALSAGDGGAALEIARVSLDFMDNRGRFEQRLNWAQRAAAALANHADDLLRASAQNVLGRCYQQLPLGDRQDNLQRAIAAFEMALVYGKPEVAPLEYAWTQNGLGNTYGALAEMEDRAGNLRRAIAAYEAALVYRKPEVAPLAYASTQNNLGVAYKDLSQVEDRASNLRRAIAAFETALVYRKPKVAPLDYATTQNNLGTTYYDLSQVEDRAGNLRQAIAAFEAALVYWTPETAPLAYALTRTNLGATYWQLSAVEDRAGNLRRAIATYQTALVYRKPEVAPLGYAATQNNLGNVYQDLSEVEDREGNLRRAIAAFEAALIYWTPDTAPLDYAMTQYNLGGAYTCLSAVEDRAGNLRRAIAAYQTALVYRKPEVAPLDYAITQNGLGLAYRNLSEVEEREANLRLATAALEAALVYQKPEIAPLDYAATQSNLGDAQRDLGNLAAAIACWREAEKYFRQMDYAAEADRVLRQLAEAEAEG